MAVIESACSCGEKVQVRTGEDVTSTMRRDGKQAVYPKDKNSRYSIFRCKTCLKPADETVPGYQYE